MKLYLIEALVTPAETTPYVARTWAVSQAEAASTRARYTSELGVARKDIRTNALDVDTRKEGLVALLNQLARTGITDFFDGAKV